MCGESSCDEDDRLTAIDAMDKITLSNNKPRMVALGHFRDNPGLILLSLARHIIRALFFHVGDGAGANSASGSFVTLKSPFPFP